MYSVYRNFNFIFRVQSLSIVLTFTAGLYPYHVYHFFPKKIRFQAQITKQIRTLYPGSTVAKKKFDVLAKKECSVWKSVCFDSLISYMISINIFFFATETYLQFLAWILLFNLSFLNSTDLGLSEADVIELLKLLSSTGFYVWYRPF